mgnify:CR=1 FL=1
MQPAIHPYCLSRNCSTKTGCDVAFFLTLISYVIKNIKNETNIHYLSRFRVNEWRCNLKHRFKLVFIFVVNLIVTQEIHYLHQNETNSFRIWGPGLHPRSIVMPARYFFIQINNGNNNISKVLMLTLTKL